MSRIFMHNMTGQIIAKTPNGIKEYTTTGEWRDAPDDTPVTSYPLLYAGLERSQRWSCCGGIQLASDDKCPVCNESY